MTDDRAAINTAGQAVAVEPTGTQVLPPAQNDLHRSLNEEGRNLAFRMNLVDQVCKTVRWCAVLLAGWGCFYVAGDALKAYAGRHTVFDAVVGLFQDSGSGITISFSLTLNLLLGSWALRERKLRLRKVEDLATRKAKLEQMIHPERTTSGLHPDGRTHPRDR